MFKRLFDRKPQANTRAKQCRRRTALGVQQLESRRLFAADVFSVGVEPPPVAGPDDVAAEVSNSRNSAPSEELALNFAKVEFHGVESQTGSERPDQLTPQDTAKPVVTIEYLVLS